MKKETKQDKGIIKPASKSQLRRLNIQQNKSGVCEHCGNWTHPKLMGDRWFNYCDGCKTVTHD